MEDSMDPHLEQELESHLQEQRASLILVDAALELEPSNSELSTVREELRACVKATEDSIFQLKRERLLKEIESGPACGELITASALSLRKPVPVTSKQSVSSDSQVDIRLFTKGAKCRFRHLDGRWYNGKIVDCEDGSLPRVHFMSPTDERMQICRFFLQQRCRFGDTCRQSHGVEVPLHALRLFKRPSWEAVALGTSIYACDGDQETGLWGQAELEAWDDEYFGRARVAFVEDGRRAVVDAEMMAFSEYADLTDASSDASSAEEDIEEDEEEELDETEGIGVFVRAGVQTDTVTFASWEKHTRGVASKMMTSMGYRAGTGLGVSGQGQLAPLEARILPPRQSLDFINQSRKEICEEGERKRKKKRGGKRSRARKWARATLASKIERDKQADVFVVINQHLATFSENCEMNCKSRSELNHSNSGEPHGVVMQRKSVRKEDRISLVVHEDTIMDLRSKISKLEDMASRNRKEKAIFDGVLKKLEVARKALQDAEAAKASATNAVHNKDKEKSG